MTEKNILPGLKPVRELLEREPERVDHVFVRKGRPGPESARLLDVCRANGIRFSLVPEEALARLAGPARHQGVAARLREAGSVMSWEEALAAAPHAPLPLLVALDQVQDPGNTGTLIRTLYALGGAGLVLPRHNSAFLGPGARRAAAGALERLPVITVTNLARAVEDAAHAGLATYAAGLPKTEAARHSRLPEQSRAENTARRDPCGRSGVSDVSLPGPAALDALTAPLRLPALLVLGNEDKGVRPGVSRRCDAWVAVPFLREFDSLNVAQAGAILISCFLRAAGKSAQLS